MTSYDTFKNPITIGDTVVVGQHSCEAITYTGDFYECIVLDIEKTENGPFGDILHLKKDKYGRNLKDEVTSNKSGEYSTLDLKAVESEVEYIKIFSNAVITVKRDNNNA